MTECIFCEAPLKPESPMSKAGCCPKCFGEQPTLTRMALAGVAYRAMDDEKEAA